MGQKHFFTGWRNTDFFVGIFVASLLCAGSGVWATTHVVNFGGALGLVFSPSSFTAQVGDTVRWVGDFTIHTTTSTSVPVGAQTWNFGPGNFSSFSYAIKVAGTYHYECAIHVSSGMVGSFTANPSAILTVPTKQSANHAAIVTITPSGKSFIRFTAPGDRRVSLSIMDLRGRAMATIIDRALPAGAYTEPLNGAIKAKGIYFVNLQGASGEGGEVFQFLN
jgi:plastocyanin